MHGVKAHIQEEFLNKMDKVSLSTEKGGENTSKETYKEFNKELEDLSPFEDEVVKPSKKKIKKVKKEHVEGASSQETRKELITEEINNMKRIRINCKEKKKK